MLHISLKTFSKLDFFESVTNVIFSVFLAIKVIIIINCFVITMSSGNIIVSCVGDYYLITKCSCGWGPQEMTPWAVKDPPNHIFCNHYQKVFIVVISVITILYYQEHSPGNDTVGCERLLI